MPHLKKINTYLQINFGFGRSLSLCQAAPVLILFAHPSKQQLPWKSQEIFGLLRTQLLMLLEFFPPPSVSTRIKTLVCWSISGFWHIWSFTGECGHKVVSVSCCKQGQNSQDREIQVLATSFGPNMVMVGGRRKCPKSQRGDLMSFKELLYLSTFPLQMGAIPEQ